VSWGAILGLAGGCYLLKAVGPLALSGREIPVRARSVLELLAVPLLAALVAVQTMAHGEALVLDARLPALGVAAVLVWRRAPFIVVVLAAAAAASLGLGPLSVAPGLAQRRAVEEKQRRREQQEHGLVERAGNRQQRERGQPAQRPGHAAVAHEDARGANRPREEGARGSHAVRR
jgi:membrane protein implicated in regulation of membrane protease activity